MNSISTEAKVGLFILVGLIILGYMSFKVGQVGFGMKKGYNVSVLFDNVSGLKKDAAVQMAGVDIGRVESIRLENDKARVTLKINPSVQLERDVTAAIKTHGILGDKYIEILPGTRSAGYLKSGEQIARTERQADIDKLLNELTYVMSDIRNVTTSLSHTLGGEEGEANLRRIVANVRDLSDHLNQVVVKNDEKFAELVTNLRNASIEMERTFASLSEITGGINRGEGTVGQLVKNPEVAERLNKTLASLQSISDKINEGKGTIGKLVNDEETVKNLNESLGGINRYVTKAEQFRTYLGFRGEYLFEKGSGKSYVDMTIKPKEDRFYTLGIAYDPRGRRTDRVFTAADGTQTTQTEYDRSGILFNAEIGKRWKDVALRGGLLESTGGAGIDYYMMNDKLKFSFEAFDFAQDRNPHLKAWGEYRLFKHVYLTAGWDDFISRQGNSSVFGGMAIRFEDEDLKYLLTTTPIPR
jgi:phospholipid/cholesterol/gamma-HCH transport system substrate-binding protein